MDPHWPASSALPPHLRPKLGAARLRAHWETAPLVHALGVREPMPHGLVRRAGGPDLFIACFHQSVQARLTEGLREVPANSLVAWAPGAGQVYGREDAAWLHSWLHLREPAGPALASACSLPLGVALALPSPDGFEAALGELHAEMAAPAPDAVVIESLVVVLLRRLARLAGPADPLAVVRRRIAEHPEARHRLADLAALAGCGPQHLCRAFRERYATTPLAFAGEMRLERAARLLSSGLAPAQAAAQCGWADVRQFARVFRARFGRTPAAWRDAGR